MYRWRPPRFVAEAITSYHYDESIRGEIFKDHGSVHSNLDFVNKIALD